MILLLSVAPLEPVEVRIFAKPLQSKFRYSEFAFRDPPKRFDLMQSASLGQVNRISILPSRIGVYDQNDPRRFAIFGSCFPEKSSWMANSVVIVVMASGGGGGSGSTGAQAFAFLRRSKAPR
jgi:hypothetical protein